MNTQSDRGWAAVLVSAIMVTTAAARVTFAQETFKTLVDFDGINGESPYASLVQGLDGSFYGTTYFGGANGRGTLFKMTPAGALTTLYNFCVQTGCRDGTHPEAGLVEATDGNFYGTTLNGGDLDYCSQGCGTVFKISPSGALTTLHRFCTELGCPDGLEPAGLVQGIDGNFYGTTSYGGDVGAGTVFKISATGTLITLYSFCTQSGCTDGYEPTGALIQAIDGNFYGTTVSGGRYPGGGTVFKITPTGVLTRLHSFCSQTNCTDGGNPAAGLVQSADGNFYGTTVFGGTRGSGTVFQITPSGALITLYSFCAQTNCSDGATPKGVLVQATDGNLYGTTYEGGSDECGDPNGCGTEFKITADGTLTMLHAFRGADGARPIGGTVQATSGRFYGTASGGGNNDSCDGGCGTVFSLAAGLGPFVETLPSSSKVGAPLKILGTDLTGATSVTFDGVSATFQVVSQSEIETSVPSGATTGPVQVVTPAGTLTSNVPFHVIQ